jgi:hypothetical protein
MGFCPRFSTRGGGGYRLHGRGWRRWRGGCRRRGRRRRVRNLRWHGYRDARFVIELWRHEQRRDIDRHWAVGRHGFAKLRHGHGRFDADLWRQRWRWVPGKPDGNRDRRGYWQHQCGAAQHSKFGRVAEWPERHAGRAAYRRDNEQKRSVSQRGRDAPAPGPHPVTARRSRRIPVRRL